MKRIAAFAATALVCLGIGVHSQTLPPPARPVANAAQIEYDNTTSGLSATQVQAALDEIKGTGGGASHIIKDTGTPLPTRAGLNFLGDVECLDDFANSETDCTFTGGAGGGITGITADSGGTTAGTSIILAGGTNGLNTSRSVDTITLSFIPSEVGTDAFTDAQISNTLTASIFIGVAGTNAVDLNSIETAGLLPVTKGGTGVGPTGDDYLFVATGTATGAWTQLLTCTDGTHYLDWTGTTWQCTAVTGGAEVNALESTGAQGIADHEVPLGTGAGTVAYTGIPNCNTENSLTYNTGNHTFGCEADAAGGGGDSVLVNGVASTDPDLRSEGVVTTTRCTGVGTPDARCLQAEDVLFDTSQERLIVTATANLAGVAGTLEGVDIQAAITACGATDACEVRLVAGTYTNVCVEISQRNVGTYIVGKGVGVTILQPYADLDDCGDDGPETILGSVLGAYRSDNVTFQDFEIDGNKDAIGPPDEGFCDGNNSCGGGIDVGNDLDEIHSGLVIRNVYIHDTIRHGIAISDTRDFLVEKARVVAVGCNQSISACNAAWNAEPDLGLGNRTNASGIILVSTVTNGIVRNSTVDRTTYTGLEMWSSVGAGTCGPEDSNCPTNIQFLDNEIFGAMGVGLVLNSGQDALVRGNRVHGVGMPGAAPGDDGTGILVAGSSVHNVTIEGNTVWGNRSYGMYLKGLAPGGVFARGNYFSSNCTNSAVGKQAFVNMVGGTEPHNYQLVDNFFEDSVACGGVSLTIGGFANTTPIKVYGGKYDGDVEFNGGALDVMGLQVTGDLTFGATTLGIARANTVTGSTTNSGGVCILENDSTPIPATCVSGGVGGMTSFLFDSDGDTPSTIGDGEEIVVSGGKGLASTSGTNTVFVNVGYTDRLNPGVNFNARECVFTDEGDDGTSGGGFLCEAVSGDNAEQLYLFPPGNGNDILRYITTGASASTDNIADNEVLVGTGAGTGLYIPLLDCANGTHSLDWDAVGGQWACNPITVTSGGWTDGTNVITETVTTDEVIIGGAAALGGAKFTIDGDFDQPQLWIQTHSTQAAGANILTIENSGLTDLLTLDNSGNLVLFGSVTAGDPGDNLRVVKLIDNTTDCPNPIVGTTSFCSVAGVPSYRVNNGSTTSLLGGGGDLGANLSSTTNDITSDNSIITLAGTTESLTLTYTADTATWTTATGVSTINFPGTGSIPAADIANGLTDAQVGDIALGGGTSGNYVESVADGTGIDGTAGADGSSAYTPTLDLTEITTATLGNTNFTTLILDPTGGANNPTFTAADNSVVVTNAATFNHVDGSIPVADLATETRSMHWGAGSWSVDGTNCATAGQVEVAMPTGGPKLWSATCAVNAAARAWGSTRMPTGWDEAGVTFSVGAFNATSETLTCNVDITCQCVGDGEAANTTFTSEVAGTEVSLGFTTLANQVQWVEQGAPITCTGTCADNDRLTWQLEVETTGTSANCGTNVKFTDVRMEYVSNVGD